MTSLINDGIVELMFKIPRLLKENMNFDSKTSHLTVLQLQTLVFLKKKGKSQMKEISDQFSITMPTATSLLDKLIDMKLVEREEDKNDRRIVIISLTESGKKILQEAIKNRNIKMSKLLSYLNFSDKKELLRIMGNLVKKLEEDHEK